MADTVGVGAGWTLAAGAGAVRANMTVMPTVASTPSWPVRQVSRLTRRRLSSRAPLGDS
jgi:hypothetical protein